MLTAQERKDIAARWSVTDVVVWMWDRPTNPVEHKRRIQAAQHTHTLTDVPVELGKWLDEQFGVTRGQVAEFYGYSPDSLWRFCQDPTCHNRLLDMVAYYVSVREDE